MANKNVEKCLFKTIETSGLLTTVEMKQLVSKLSDFKYSETYFEGNKLKDLEYNYRDKERKIWVKIAATCIMLCDINQVIDSDIDVKIIERDNYENIKDLYLLPARLFNDGILKI